MCGFIDQSHTDLSLSVGVDHENPYGEGAVTAITEGNFHVERGPPLTPPSPPTSSNHVHSPMVIRIYLLV